MKKISLSLLVLAVMLISAALAAPAAERTLSVTGTGLVQVAPDTARVRLGVEVSRKTAPEAQSDNADLMQKIMAAIAKQGIAKEKLQTAGFNVWPETKYEPNQPPRTTGYRCTNQVNVTIEDLARIAKVIDAGISAGANNVQGIQFSRKDDAAFKKQALDLAVKEAAGKAAAIALAAGLKLGGIKSIVESGAAVPPAADYGVRAMNLGGGAETPVAPGLLEISGGVTLTYWIE